MRASDIQIGSNDGVASTDHTKVASSDAMRVRVAIGFMILIAMLDCVLYLPRLF
jgi:hypothetical protein